MSDPMPYATFIRILRAAGLTVIEEETNGQSPANHNRNHKGPWGEVYGVLVHHTVTKGHDSTVSICRTGHSTLPGPLCHGVICKAGHVHVVGYGRANHAGLGDPDVLAAVKAERPLPADNQATVDGNRHFYGFECENLGDGKDPWPAVQLETIEKACAAIARHHRWNERSTIGHLEWQPGKVDPRGFTMDSMRARIKSRLAGDTPGDVPEEQEEAVPTAISRSIEDGFTVPAGEWVTVDFDGVSLVKEKTHYSATAYVRLTNLPLGSTVQGRFYHLRGNGSRWSSPVVERSATDGDTFVDFHNEGSIVPAEEARFELVVFPAGGVKEARVVSGYVRGLAWE